MAEIIGAPWCIAMGDDSVEGYVPEARSKYLALGHTCKDYMPCQTDVDGNLLKVNFCSHELSEGKFWLTSWPKTLYRFLSSSQPDLADLQAELWGCPMWKRIERYVTSKTDGDKIELQDAHHQTDPKDGREGDPAEEAATQAAETWPPYGSELKSGEEDTTCEDASLGWYRLW